MLRWLCYVFELEEQEVGSVRLSVSIYEIKMYVLFAVFPRASTCWNIFEISGQELGVDLRA